MGQYTWQYPHKNWLGPDNQTALWEGTVSSSPHNSTYPILMETIWIKILYFKNKSLFEKRTLKQKATNIWKTALHIYLRINLHFYIKKQYIHSSHFGTIIIQITKARKSTIISALLEGRRANPLHLLPPWCTGTFWGELKCSVTYYGQSQVLEWNLNNFKS